MPLARSQIPHFDKDGPVAAPPQGDCELDVLRWNVISHFPPTFYPSLMSRPGFLAFALTALMGSLATPPAQAFDQADVVRGDFRPGWLVKPGTHMAALHLELAPSWKTYWRAPGDAGIPPSFNWSGSENLQAVRFHWPRPSVFDLNGTKTVGYHDRLILPIEVVAADPSRPVRLRAMIDLGVCSDICVPASLKLDVLLDGPGAPDALIDTALAAVPQTAAQAGLSDIGCSVDPIDDGLRVTARIEIPQLGPDETVVFESGMSGVWVSESESDRAGGTLVAASDMVPPNGAPFALDRSGVTLTVISADRAVEIRGCPAP